MNRTRIRFQSSALLVVLVTALAAGCASPRRAAPDTSQAIPITFEVYYGPDTPKAIGYHNLGSITRMLKSECIYRVEIDAREGIPVAMIRAHSHRFNKGLVSLPETGFLRETRWLRHLIPEDLQRIFGGIDVYLLHVSPHGSIESVVHEDRNSSGGSWIFDQCRPGDKIVADYYF